MGEFTNLISNVGFPIAAFCMMFWQNTQLSKTIDANTKALTELSERVGNIEEKVGKDS